MLEWVDGLSALERDSSKRTLRVQALKSLPVSLTLASDVANHYADLPPCDFVHDPDEQRLLAPNVAVATGEAILRGNGAATQIVAVAGLAILSVGNPDGLFAVTKLDPPITIEFGVFQLRMRLALLAQTSLVGR